MDKKSLILLITGAALIIGAALGGYLIRGYVDRQDDLIAAQNAGIATETVLYGPPQLIIKIDSTTAVKTDNLKNKLNDQLDSLKSIMSVSKTEADSIITNLNSTIDSLMDIACNKTIFFDTTMRIGYWKYQVSTLVSCAGEMAIMTFKPLPESYAGPNFKQDNVSLGLGGATVFGRSYFAGHIRINSFNIMPLYNFSKEWGIIATYTKSFRLF